MIGIGARATSTPPHIGFHRPIRYQLPARLSFRQGQVIFDAYPSGRRELVWWWASGLAGFRRTNETVFGGIPVFAGLSDGPYKPRHLRKKLLGRVVGYAEAALGGLLQPCAGWAD
jgi:hypothetical protein